LRAPGLWEECRTATRGCVQNKRELGEALIAMTEPFRAIRATLGAGAHERAEAILRDGAARARVIARQTIEEVKQLIGLGKTSSKFEAGSSKG